MSVVRADAVALPFGDRQFDAAVLCGTLGSLSNPEDFLVELHRVMREGGTVACIAQDFSHKLQVEKESRVFRLSVDDHRLRVHAVEYLVDPYRMRESRHTIRRDTKAYRRLMAEHADGGSGQSSSTMAPAWLPPDAISEAIYSETIQYGADSLVDALGRAGFRKRSIALRSLFGLQHIFAVFER
jgi:SAM-dependent methyltransferase